jgi:hypothetical protein
MKLGPGEPAADPWQVMPLPGVLHRLGPLPRIVAVDGRSAGGKTTVAGVLAGAVENAAVLHTDDIAWHHSFFDWADLLIDGVLTPLRRGEPVRYRPPGWIAKNRPGAIEIPAGLDLLVVEGVGAGRRELAAHFDALIWVQSDFDEAERRGIERDGGDQAVIDFWNEWMAAEIPFLADQKPWERATLVVAGTPELPYDRTTELVVSARGGRMWNGRSSF